MKAGVYLVALAMVGGFVFKLVPAKTAILVGLVAIIVAGLLPESQNTT